MTKVVYEVVEHDGGWAYKVGDSYSETFANHAAASAAAQRAAAEQQVAGRDEGLLYQDADGAVHEETVEGEDRPETIVRD